MSTDSNNDSGVPQDDGRLDPQYAKYSTEQLEIIFTRALDLEEKTRVRNELTKRYYRHYRDIAAKEPTSADREDKYTAVGDQPLLENELESLAEEAGCGLTRAWGEGESQTAPAEAAPSGIDPKAELVPGKTPVTAAPAPPPKSLSKKLCFIATAAYGSPLAPEVALLSYYRDNYLCRHLPGRLFIRIYYQLSPYPAAWISRNKVMRVGARRLLTPVIHLIRKAIKKKGQVGWL